MIHFDSLVKNYFKLFLSRESHCVSVVGACLYRLNAVATNLAVVAPLTDLRARVATGRSDRWLTTLADCPAKHFAGDLFDLVWLSFGRVDFGPSR